MCYPVELKISREAAAIASCESGDGVTIGSLSWTARNKLGSSASGAFQFLDSTYIWLNGYSNADVDSPKNQYDTFVYLWNNGKGWSHWEQSRPCWSKWLRINEHNVAVWKD